MDEDSAIKFIIGSGLAMCIAMGAFLVGLVIWAAFAPIEDVDRFFMGKAKAEWVADCSTGQARDECILAWNADHPEEDEGPTGTSISNVPVGAPLGGGLYLNPF